MYCLFCVVLCIVCVCICVLYYCHRMATQLQLNIYHTITWDTYVHAVHNFTPNSTDTHTTIILTCTPTFLAWSPRLHKRRVSVRYKPRIKLQELGDSSYGIYFTKMRTPNLTAIYIDTNSRLNVWYKTADKYYSPNSRPLKMEALRFFETSEPGNPKMQRHGPEGNCQLHLCEIPKLAIKKHTYGPNNSKTDSV